MKRPMVLSLAVLALAAFRADAEHANIDLRVFRLDPQTGQTLSEASATADRDPPAGGYNPRPLFKVAVDEPLALQFVLTNTYPHGETPNVTVQYFVVREKEIRQKEVPSLNEGVVTQGHFVMNFKPKCRVGARINFSIKEPGNYLLRVHTLETNSDHEHFSAIDIQAEGRK